MSRIETPEIDLHNYGQLIFDRGSKAIQWKKVYLFNNNNKKENPSFIWIQK